MDTLIIFSAKHLVYISAVISVAYFLLQPRKKQKEIFIFTVILFSLAYILAKIGGLVYFDPRPFVMGNFTPLIPHAPDNGFPSDHTLLAAVLAAAVFRFEKRLGALLLFFALLVGAARILAGVHHALDIAGSFLAVLIVYVIASYFSLWQKRERK